MPLSKNRGSESTVGILGDAENFERPPQRTSKLNIQAIISQIDQEIVILTKVKEALQGVPAKRGPGRPPRTAAVKSVSTKKTAKRTMSAEGRARIAAAQKARWAKLKGKK